jgi:hypothetical protein
VPARGEKIPSSGRAGGAELEGAADAERSKPMEVRGTWDMVFPEGGQRGDLMVEENSNSKLIDHRPNKLKGVSSEGWCVRLDNA